MPTDLLAVFPGFGAGGAQMRFCALANRLRFRACVVALNGDLSCAARLDPSLNVQFPSVTVRKGDTLGNVLRLRRLLRGQTVLVTHNWGSIEAAMANAFVGLRHIHIEDGFGPEERDRQILRRVWLRRLFLRRATLVLPSRTLVRIAADSWRLKPVYIPNGIDLARFAVADPPPGPPTIGTVAGLRPEKNVARLIRAFALLRVPARLVIVGDGPERPGLEALATSLGIADRVTFAYRHFSVFALSSDTEQMPLSLLEAMASALPVAATDVGDVAAMLAEDNRRFVVAQSDAALAGALAALLADAGLRRALGAANAARATLYGEDAMARAYAELLASA
jgi:glycosyltransferase involved in cell wall biosynthesis